MPLGFGPTIVDVHVTTASMTSIALTERHWSL